ncbi:MAG: YbaY family lipoprotein, partial [Candidatus Limnocylindrales bacterium]
MGSIRPTRRLWVAAVALVLAFPIVATAGAAAASQVTGTLSFTDQIALSKNAVAIVVLLDQTADPNAGAILGEDRIDDPGAVPIAFSVPYTAAIDQAHSYALYASIVDGTNTWENDEPVPVITGGPTSGV